jgi:GntR family transcriptional repressor for pyruvate dehydrogenase complex
MATSPRRRRRRDAVVEGGAEQVVSFVRGLIERKALRPGDRLPAERDLATRIGVSRPTVRMGLHALAAMGCVESRHGSGTYIPAGPPSLDSAPLSLLAALHDFSHQQMYDARRILEVGAAGLAAEFATADQLATLADEIAGLFASMDDPQRFLVHDINFHRQVATAYEQRRQTAEQASDVDLRDAAALHRDIYQAIRAHDADSARRLMNEHLLRSSAHQAEEREKARVVRPARVRRASGR